MFTEISARFCRKPAFLKNILFHQGLVTLFLRPSKAGWGLLWIGVRFSCARVISASPLPRADDFSAVLPHICNRAGKRRTFWESELPTSLWPFLPTSEPLMSVCPSSWATSIHESSASFIVALGHIFYHCLWRYSDLGQTSCITGTVGANLNRCPLLISCTSGISSIHLRGPLGSQCHWQ